MGFLDGEAGMVAGLGAPRVGAGVAVGAGPGLTGAAAGVGVRTGEERDGGWVGTREGSRAGTVVGLLPPTVGRGTRVAWPRIMASKVRSGVGCGIMVGVGVEGARRQDDRAAARPSSSTAAMASIRPHAATCRPPLPSTLSMPWSPVRPEFYPTLGRCRALRAGASQKCDWGAGVAV